VSRRAGLAALALVACGTAAAPQQQPTTVGNTTTAGVVGTLTITGSPAAAPRELTLHATVRNQTSTPWPVPVVPLAIPQLSVVVTDALGARLPTYPPPVPQPGDDRTEPLAPGASRSFDLVGLPMDLTAGVYVVTWGAAAGIVEAQATFEIQ